MTTHEKSTEKTICPFLSNPMGDCYCVRNETVYIDKVLSLCGGNFASCDVYRGNARGGSNKYGEEPKGGINERSSTVEGKRVMVKLDREGKEEFPQPLTPIPVNEL